MKLSTKYEEAKKKMDCDTLKKLLLEENKTYKDIGIEYNVCKRIVSKLAKEYNIPKNYKAIVKNSTYATQLDLDMNMVVRLYCQEKWSIRKIAKHVKSTHGTISKRLKNENVNIRSGSSAIYYIDRRKRKSHECIDGSGYLQCDNKRKHREVMEDFLGRKLKYDETVHHRDLDKLNNNIDNLFLFQSNEQHRLYHGYIKANEFITCEDFMQYYYKNINPRYNNYDWMYNEYIIKKQSCNSISKILKISRRAVVGKLKKMEIYNKRCQTINQFG